MCRNRRGRAGQNVASRAPQTCFGAVYIVPQCENSQVDTAKRSMACYSCVFVLPLSQHDRLNALRSMQGRKISRKTAIAEAFPGSQEISLLAVPRKSASGTILVCMAFDSGCHCGVSTEHTSTRTGDRHITRHCHSTQTRDVKHLVHLSLNPTQGKSRVQPARSPLPGLPRQPQCTQLPRSHLQQMQLAPVKVNLSMAA